MVAVQAQVTFDSIAERAAKERLAVMCALHEKGDTILLLGPEADFWTLFKTSPEYQDKTPDPMDRWSSRVITAIAEEIGADPLFPFGGPPYQPFLRWALRSGWAWSSPVGMLVHDRAGMMISFRGGLRIAGEIDLPTPPKAAPCESCEDKPCTTGCPVGALSDQHFYKVDDCYDYLDTLPGAICRKGGCRARLACPVSAKFDRDPAQSALHMSYFHRK